MTEGIANWIKARPRRIGLGLLVLALAAVALGGLLWYRGSSSSTSSSGLPGSTYEGTRLDRWAQDFRLVDQSGAPTTLSQFRGRVVLLAFLDPECTDVCPLTANEFRLTSQKLGERATGVVFLAVNVNPQKNSLEDVAGATRKWGVQDLQNWHYVTGTRDELEPIYRAYNVQAEGPPKPDKPDELEHTPGVYIIDKAGQERWYVSTAFDPKVSLSDLLIKRVGALLEAQP